MVIIVERVITVASQGANNVHHISLVRGKLQPEINIDELRKEDKNNMPSPRNKVSTTEMFNNGGN